MQQHTSIIRLHWQRRTASIHTDAQPRITGMRSADISSYAECGITFTGWRYSPPRQRKEQDVEVETELPNHEGKTLECR